VGEVPSDVLDRLYQLPPERFVAARDEAVEAARRTGDRDTASAIAGLRRPTVAAWLVNLLARRRTELVDDLLELGEALRRAQRDLRGEELRELSTRRRAAVVGLVAEARKLAREAGRSGRENLPLTEVEATLSAALAEPELADAVRAGTLTKATGYAGFGEQPRPRLRVIDGGRKEKEKAPPAKRGGEPSAEDKAAAAKAAEAARTKAKEAEAELRSAERAERDAARALAELTAQLDELRDRQARAQLDLRQARLRLKTAQREAARIRT
jgi:DNA repair exonuclease SbcCD ATPase subunit